MMIVAQTIELFEMHTTHETFSSKRPETNGFGTDQKVEAVLGASTVVQPYNQFMQNKSSRDTRIAQISLPKLRRDSVACPMQSAAISDSSTPKHPRLHHATPMRCMPYELNQPKM
jgi:hypothetical protein